MNYGDMGTIDFERILGPAYQLQRSMQRIENAIMPQSVRAMLEAQDRLRAATSASLLDHAGLQALRTRLTPHEQLFASMTAVTEAMHMHDLVATMSTAASFASELRDLLGPGLAISALPTFQLARNLAKTMPEPLHLQWQEHLVRSLTPSFDLLSTWADGPVGLLAFMSEPTLGASLTWLSDEEDARTSAAALVAEGRYVPKIAIDTVVHCIVCDTELIQNGETLRWRGNRIQIDITVVPLCATCLQEAHDDAHPQSYADHVVGMIDDLRRPRLRLVHQGGQSDGVPRGRGKLRLVRREDEQDDVDQDDE